LTLVELMVTVALIAIIAAVAIATFQAIQKKAKLAADNAHVASMRSAVAIYYGRRNGIFPPDITSVYALVRPPINDASFHCAAPTYHNSNGKVEFTASIDDCP
jgi:type II secretory pathway pseudopilin PulG